MYKCREEIDINNLITQFQSLYPQPHTPILILYDVTYSHVTDELKTRLSNRYDDLVVSELYISDNESCINTCSTGVTTHVTVGEPSNKSCDGHMTSQILFGRVLNITRPLTDYKVLFIGTEGPVLTNFMLTLRNNEFHSYDPRSQTTRHETVSVNKMLGRRYYLVQRAKEAMTVGILVGTLGVVDYIPMIERLKEVLTSVGKKYYTVAVGKVNPAKLANLMEIDIYVLVACPECSLLQSQEFYKPVVTPYEMEVACLSNRQWTGDVVLDYTQLLKDKVDVPDVNGVEPDLSLISGRLVNRDSGCGLDTPTSQTLALRDGRNELMEQHTGASYLQTRSWQGLEVKLGNTRPSEVIEGMRGVATHYTHEDHV